MTLTPRNRSGLCRFTYTNGRYCRMLLSSSHSYLCIYHARKESQATAAQKVAHTLAASLSHNYITACDLTAAMSQLFAAIAQGHIKPRTANTLAYVGQTIAQTLRMSQQEFISAYGTQAWRAAIRDALASAHTNINPLADATERSTPDPLTSADSALAEVCENARLDLD
jgi:hypothetical protein